MRAVHKLLRLGSRELQLGTRTYVMGIINVTPDSFAGDGLLRPTARESADVDVAVLATRLASQMVAEGADLIDVGGESTHPRATPVPLEEELERVIPVIEHLSRAVQVPVSIDTSKSEVARQAIAAGAQIVNDVTALRRDPEMAAVIAQRGASVILMHGGSVPGMSDPPAVPDVIEDVVAFLRARIESAVAAGIASECILVDPGFGFGKTIAYNLELLRRLGELRVLGRPLVLGPSRKGTIGKVVGTPVEERLEGTAAAVALAIAQGVDVVRVHDVKAMVRVARMADAVVRGWSDG